MSVHFTARLLGVAVLAAGLLPSAHAGQLVATASQNTVGLVSNPSNGSLVSAVWPDEVAPVAAAVVSRTAIIAASVGAQLPVQQFVAASGTASTNYQLWDLNSNAALDGGVAASLALNFNFALNGQFTLPPQSLSTAGVSYDAAIYSSVVDTAGNGLSGSYGPVPPFPSEGYLFTGDSALNGAYHQTFSLRHQFAAGGLWTLGLATSASNFGASAASLTLDSITLAPGFDSVAGLGVRLETGELIRVTTPVPEPATWALLLGGASVLLLRRRRSTATA